MPTYHVVNICSLDESIKYYNDYYQYAVNSNKKSKMIDFNISLTNFIGPESIKKRILDLKTYNYTILVKVTPNSSKFASSYNLSIYKNVKEKPTLLSLDQINELKKFLSYIERNDVKKDYKKAVIMAPFIIIGFILFVVSLMSISIYLS